MNSDETKQPVSGTEQAQNDLEVLTTIISALKRLDSSGQLRVFESVAAFLGIRSLGSPSSTVSGYSPRPGSGSVSFSEDRTLAAKDFLLAKQPKTDVHRVTCLAYYLTHYRDTPHFKTIDISKLNTEAAQPKFSNAAKAVDNAMKLGYLVQATRGNKQLSAVGERFVEALPDMEAAKAVLVAVRARKKPKRSQNKQSERDGDGKA